MPRAPHPALPSPSPPAGVISQLSVFLGNFRWAFMPLGLFALVAVGIHAAADTLDDRILWLVDRADAFLDRALASWALTQPLVNRVGTEQRTLFSRGLTLSWELCCDFLFALPALGYREEDAPARLLTQSFATRPHTFRALLARLWQKPSLLKVTRPLITSAVSLAGAFAIARMVEGALHLSLPRGLAGPGLALPLSRLLALAAFALVLFTFGWRAVLRSFQHADKLSEQATWRGRRAVSAGLISAALGAPLALAALLDACPLLSFFR